jgi:HD-GYP domain-containing protein (c-di-GMP phosphodiesterase class II)
MDITKEKVLSNQLRLGMFIADLDRPWLGTPFLLQGFVLEEDEQLQTLKQLCEFVYVDRTKSIGDQFGSKVKVDIAIKRESVPVIIKQAASTKQPNTRVNTAPKVMVKTTNNQKKTLQQSNFFEIMSAIKKGEITQTNDGIIFNVREVKPSASASAPLNGTHSAESTQPDTDSNGSALGFLRNLFGNKKEKLKTPKSNGETDDDPFGITESEMYRIHIYQNEVPRVEQEMAVIYPTYEKTQIATKEIFEAIANKQHLDISTVSEVLDHMVDSISRTPDALMWLAKLKDADNVAYAQALNVSINMMAFSSFLALPKLEIKEMGLAGLLQDLGKVKIPQRILLKNAKLSPTEFEIAKLHIEEGLRILAKTSDIPDSVIEVIAQHHERYDGSGYPNNLDGEQIQIRAQIAGLIDTYCALTTDRSYAKSIHNLKALDEIHQMRDKLFSSELVEQLIQFFGIYPVSSLVELNSGEIGVVIQQNQVRRLLPRVMVVLAPDRTRNEFPVTLDLLNSPKTPDGEVYKIVRAVTADSLGLHAEDFYI